MDLLTKVLALEWAPHGVTVNTVAPTYAYTPGTAERLDDPAVAADVLARIPAGRFATTADIAAAVIYLASPIVGDGHRHRPAGGRRLDRPVAGVVDHPGRCGAGAPIASNDRDRRADRAGRARRADGARCHRRGAPGTRCARCTTTSSATSPTTATTARRATDDVESHAACSRTAATKVATNAQIARPRCGARADPPQHGDGHPGPGDVAGRREQRPDQQGHVHRGDAVRREQRLEPVAHRLQRREAHARRDADQHALTRVAVAHQQVDRQRDGELGRLLDEADGEHRDGGQVAQRVVLDGAGGERAHQPADDGGEHQQPRAGRHLACGRRSRRTRASPSAR